MNDFAMYRLPYAAAAYRIDDMADEPLTLMSASELDDVKGFVMAPFVVSADAPIIVIRGEAKRIDLPVENVLIKGVEHADREAYAKDFEAFHSAIVSGQFSKLVLSRCSEVVADKPFAVEKLFSEACHRYPRMMIALVSSGIAGTWLMATPEILIAADGDKWRTMALAGTMPYQGSLDCRWSQKNIAEQKFVADYISQCLQPFVMDMEVSEPYTVRAGNVVHLRSDFSFCFNKDAACGRGIGNVVEALHPTPAVCGLPKQEAMDFILDNETGDRRYYSGYFGPWNIAGESSLFVSLRCMEISGCHCFMHAGGGLLADSVEQSEWNETVIKMEAMRQLVAAGSPLAPGGGI